MSYYNMAETEKRLAEVRKILKAKGLDAALIYFDELNVANGWYLTGWCGQFEKGAVLVPIEGEPYLLGGPESEPFAQMNSAITKVRCFPVFMVPNEEYPNAVIMRRSAPTRARGKTSRFSPPRICAIWPMPRWSPRSVRAHLNMKSLLQAKPSAAQTAQRALPIPPSSAPASARRLSSRPRRTASCRRASWS